MLVFWLRTLEIQKKNYPISISVCVGLIITTYLLPILVAIGTVPPDTRYEGVHSYPRIADQLGLGPWLGYVLIGGSIVSNFGTYNAYLTTSSSCLYAMALEGNAPNFLSKLLPRFNTPYLCILLQCGIAAALGFFGFASIVQIETILYSCHIILLFSTLIKLRFSAPLMTRPFKIPGGKIFAFIIFAFPSVVAILNIVFSGHNELLVSLAVLLAGAGIYLGVGLLRTKHCCSWRYLLVSEKMPTDNTLQTL